MKKKNEYSNEERRNIKAFLYKLSTAYFVDNRSIISPMELPEYKMLPFDIKTELRERFGLTNRFFSDIRQSQKRRYIPFNVYEKIQNNTTTKGESE